MKKTALPPAISRSIRLASKEDMDLLAKDREDAEKNCLYRHGRRVWERLDRVERDAIRMNVVDQNAKQEFSAMDASYEEYECIRIVETLLGLKK